MGDVFDELEAKYGTADTSQAVYDALEEKYGGGSGDGFNLGDATKNVASGAVEGTAGLGGLILDVIDRPIRMVPDVDYQTGQITEKKGFTFPHSEAVQSALEPHLSERDPQYRYFRTIGSFVGPQAALGLAGKAAKAYEFAGPLVDFFASQLARSEVASTTGGAVGAQAAEDVFKDTAIAPIAGAMFGGAAPSLLSSTARAARSIFAGATPAEIRGAAARTFQTVTNLTPEQIESAIANRPQDNLGRYMTTAELTENAGSAQLERTLGAETGEKGNLYSSRSRSRERTRQETLDSMSATPSVNREGLGTNLMTRGRKVDNDMGVENENLWNGVPRYEKIPVAEQQSALVGVVDQRQGGLKPSSEVRYLIDQFLDDEVGAGIQTSGRLQEIRSDALSLTRDDNLKPFEQQLLGALVSNIDDAMLKGAAPETYDMWALAREGTATQKRVFGRGTAGGTLISDTARPSEVLVNVFKGDKRSIEELRAAIRNEPALLEDVKRGVLDLIKTDSGDNLTPLKVKNFVNRNEGAIRELFGEEHATQLSRILEDLQSEASVKEFADRASKGGAPTQQRQTVAGVISKLTFGNLVPGSSKLGSFIQKLEEVAGANSKGRVDELLFRAALEPEFALELSKSPTAQRVMTVMEHLSGAFNQAKRRAYQSAGLEVSRNQEQRKNAGQYLERKKGIIREFITDRVFDRADQAAMPGTTTSTVPEVVTGQERPSRQRTPQHTVAERSPQGEYSSQTLFRPSSLDIPAPTAGNQDPVILALESLSTPRGSSAVRAVEVSPLPVEEAINQLRPGEIDMARDSVPNFNNLVNAVIAQESGGRPNAKSSKGAQGLMQLMPATAREVMSELGLDPKDYDPYDGEQNKMLGTAYLEKMLGLFNDDVPLALAAYNAGPGRIRKLLARYDGKDFVDIERYLPDETRKYVPSVVKRWAQAATIEV